MAFSSRWSAAQRVFSHLAIRHPIRRPADLVIGFGHFDPKIPRRCLALLSEGWAPRILVTGGVGAGTADLGRPEAVYFADEIRRLRPDLPDGALLVEPRSTNTSENVQMSLSVLARQPPPVRPGSALLVANAYRQRRVWLTCRKHMPHVALVNAPPLTTYEAERAMFAEKRQDLDGLLVGEIERIVRYGAQGFIESEPVPADVLEATERLRASA